MTERALDWRPEADVPFFGTERVIERLEQNVQRVAVVVCAQVRRRALRRLAR